MYQKLIVLREGLYQTVDLSCVSASGTSVVVHKLVEYDDKKRNYENAKLREENNKLKNRIAMLMKSIEGIENKK